VLGSAPRAPDAAAPRASGTLPSHYAPRTRTTLVTAGALRPAIEQRANAAGCRACAHRRTPGRLPGLWAYAPACRCLRPHLYANLGH
jgi:L-threonylcarbamoyladenylate synthase